MSEMSEMPEKLEIDNLLFQIKSSDNNMLTYKKFIEDNNLRKSELNNQLKLLDETKNILTILKNFKMESKKDFILNTINTALHDVFDQNLKIDIEATSSASTGKIHMKYDIVLYQNDIEMARNEKLLGNNGGGVLSFISILFKIMVGYIYSDNKFYLFDESISQVSPLYRPRLAQFLRKFCEQYNFTIVLISQTDDIDEFAHVGYYLSGEFDKDGVPVLKIDHLMGEYPQENYIYSKIENFQSIVKLEFRYKGFTVIRGNNNIGKSASLRAVNAIIFNSFDSKDHPRKKRSRGSETKIDFGFFGTEEDLSKKLTLRYKSNKVQYEFDDLTFSGKQLAFEKIKEKVEAIGFKYISLKDTYKNFKGNLKDQTERLAMTTQHDGFYLVGNKTNETEKVFNFLFDSTDVANAISQCNIDFNNYNNELNNIEVQLKDTQFKLKQEIINHDLFIFQYYISLIAYHKTSLEQDKMLKHRLLLINEVISITSSIMSITTGLVNLETSNIKLQDLNSNNVVLQISILEELIHNLKYNEMIQDYTDIKNLNSKSNLMKQSFEKQNILLDELQYYTESNIAISNFIFGANKLNKAKMHLSDLTIQISNIDKIEEYYNYLKSVKYYIELIAEYKTNLTSTVDNNQQSKIDKIDELILIESKQSALNNSILSMHKSKTTLQELMDKQIHWQNELSNNDKLFGIEECTCCNATGYRIKD